jgi:hypothetical protein
VIAVRFSASIVTGTTAYLLANKQPRGWLTYPISPD